MFVIQLLLGASVFAPVLLAQTVQPQNAGPISNDPDFPQVCLQSSWPPSRIGKTLLPQLPDVELQRFLAQIDTTRIKNTILKLVSFGTRHTFSSQTDPNRGIGAARDWIEKELRKYSESSRGRMKVEVQSFVQQPGSRIPRPVTISNVLAKLDGSEGKKGRVYVISGHYDSRVTDIGDYESDAPGANDDASGVAGMSHFFSTQYFSLEVSTFLD